MKNEFMLGCNYWASHAGTEMWKSWSRETVEEDFKKLVAYGAKYLRVFPNWRDFQPVHPIMRTTDEIVGYALHDADAPENPYYLDETMLERFGIFCDLAQKYGIKLIVGLLTGGMSGRVFMPPVLYGKSLSEDPVALLFEQKFVHGFAERFKDKPAVYAWDLGNECNWLVCAESRESAENWTMIISNAIRSADSTRPIVSGMHTADVDGLWTIEDQAECTDILTTHPYPFWSEYSREGTVTSTQTLMYPTFATVLNADIGNKPCLAEEVGTMGPMVCDDETSAGFMKLNLCSNWANGALGTLWWCANEQTELDFPPYDYMMCEVELGLFNKNGEAKPVVKEIKKFSDWLESADIDIPAPKYDAVCLATMDQKQWPILFSSYVLAKQAGINLKFADSKKDLPEADVYFLPSVSGNRVMPARVYCDLRKKVENGAVLYISNNNAILSDFNALVGVKVNDTEMKEERGSFALDGKNIEYRRGKKYFLTPAGAEILACDESGNPLFTKCLYGKGTVYYLNFPLEENVLGVPDAFDGNRFAVYKKVFEEFDNYPLSSNNKYIGVTRHGDRDGYVVLINYSSSSQKVEIREKDGYIFEILRGSTDVIEPFEMTVVKFKKQ